MIHRDPMAADHDHFAGLAEATGAYRSLQVQSARQVGTIRRLTEELYAARARAEYWELVASDLHADALEDAARAERPLLRLVPPLADMPEGA